MAWYDENSWLTNGMSPYISTILITLLITLTAPILLHWYLYRSSTSTNTPSFVVVGPSGAGKTALVTKLETSKTTQTHTSQAPQTIKTVLPPSSKPHSLRYRSANDFESAAEKPLLLTDTPGHAKLRHHAFGQLGSDASKPPPTGVIFVVDAANLSASAGTALSDSAEYLHDVLLALQRAHAKRKTSRSVEVAFLIAANKNDLFTALPAALVKASLEAEIGRIRETKARGIAAVGRVGKGEGIAGDDEVEGDEGDEAEPLGGSVEGKFEFKTMAEYNVDVEVVAGNAVGDEGEGVDGWWEWIARQL